MAKVSKLPNRKINRKGTPPPPQESVDNLRKAPTGELKDLNFKVPVDFKKEFKGYAHENDFASMVELLKTCFEFYKDNH
jgi:hypothetical protein